MRPFALLLTILLATAAAAQEAVPPSIVTPAPAPAPDYSNDSLMRLFRPEEPRQAPERRFHWTFGGVEFRALNMRWRIAYLPILPPLPGSVPKTNREAIDPFVLTGTEFAMTPRTFKTRRLINSELRRIERMERERGKVVATPE
jgi:hypothetical protein